MHSLLALITVAYFIISGLSFYPTSDEQFYFVQSQAEIFLAFLIGGMCCYIGKSAMPVLVGFCSYSFYLLITDVFFQYVPFYQWAIEIFVFSSFTLAYIFYTEAKKDNCI